MADAWFESPLLRVLDARGRADVRAAATERALAPGAVVFAPGDSADTLWFVGGGSIALTSPRGVRHLGPREHFGSEALLRGSARQAHATAEARSSVIEVPVAALRRVLGRAGAEAILAQEEAAARRHAFAGLLAETPLGQALDESALLALVGELREERRQPGETLFQPEARAQAAFLVTSGLVELGRQAAPVYAARGDWVGLEATLAGGEYGETATALGEVLVLSLPTALLSRLAERDQAAMERQRALGRARRTKLWQVLELANARATRHAFHELERLASARSLLSIELDSCVRCGHCTWACDEAHGSPRLERRGEQAVLALADAAGTLASRALLFPRACQHCKDPVCLVECPTGAIGRDADGSVHLREDLCTGCGACAKVCPWDAIRMAPRAVPGPPGASALVATKCDLCRGGDSPECVSACPTGAIFRAEPERDFLEVRAALGVRPGSSEQRPAAGKLSRLVARVAVVPPLVALACSGSVLEHWRFQTGALAAGVCLLLGLHAAVKRVRPVRAWIRVNVFRRIRDGLAPLVTAHSLLGALAAALVLAHSGSRVPHGVAGALVLAFGLLVAAGAFGALAYRTLPARLTRLEQRAALPEDHAAELAELKQRLFSALSEQNPARKELARRLLVPYAEALLGPLLLLVSGRTPAEEVATLRARVEALLDGRKSERLAAAGALVEASVALRVLGARRLLGRALSVWLPAHVVLSVLFGTLLVVHVVGVLR